MKKLGYPTIFCNSLVVSENGEITDFKMRCEKSKYTTVKALQSCGFETIASGDSHNDLAMIEASKAGFLFRTTEEIKAEYPQIPAYETYDELLEAIKKVLDVNIPYFHNCICNRKSSPRNPHSGSCFSIVYPLKCSLIIFQ